jgi:hypothetical protein
MARLENLTRGASVKGILPDGLVSVVDVKWIGTVAIELTYKDVTGRLGNELLYRDREPTLEVAAVGRPWSFDGDGALFRLVSEAYRIRLAYLFDPLLAVHTSLVEPLPHQITAVYGEMLPRQPLRFLLADDPGSGKTIMAGLLLKELLVRGDLQKCLIVCPGNRQLADRLAVQGYHLRITPDLDVARSYLRERYAENPEARFGLIASSKDRDLVGFGVPNDFQSTKRIHFGPWYGDAENAAGGHSCRHLREAVTEFGAQGLELDAALLAWGTDLVQVDGRWSNHNARGYQQKAHVVNPFQLRLNAYRVLLTRGRDGTVVYIPPIAELGETNDYLEASGFRRLEKV